MNLFFVFCGVLYFIASTSAEGGFGTVGRPPTCGPSEFLKLGIIKVDNERFVIAQCEPCARCEVGTFEVSPCNGTHDRVCTQPDVHDGECPSGSREVVLKFVCCEPLAGPNGEPPPMLNIAIDAKCRRWLVNSSESNGSSKGVTSSETQLNSSRSADCPGMATCLETNRCIVPWLFFAGSFLAMMACLVRCLLSKEKWKKLNVSTSENSLFDGSADNSTDGLLRENSEGRGETPPEVTTVAVTVSNAVEAELPDCGEHD